MKTHVNAENRPGNAHHQFSFGYTLMGVCLCEKSRPLYSLDAHDNDNKYGRLAFLLLCAAVNMI